MRRLFGIQVTVLCTVHLLLFSDTSTAHMNLIEPVARYSLQDFPSGNKACPCGVGEPMNNRNCGVANDRVDPDRSNNITTYTAGEQVTFRFDEYVGHGGRWRISFDPGMDANGNPTPASMAGFNVPENILLDVMDPPGKVGNIGEGSIWELTVTVPNVPCDNCTFQLVQIMDGQTQAPVPDPIGRSSYYQCADIVIVAANADAGVVDAGSPFDAGADAGNAEVDAGNAEVDAGNAEVDAGNTEVDAGNAEVDAGNAEVDAGNAEVDAGNAEVDAGNAEVDAGNAEVDAGNAEVDAGNAEVDAGGEGGDEGCRCVVPPSSTPWAALVVLLLFGAQTTRRKKKERS